VGGPKIQSNKIQDGGGRHFEKTENRNNSAAVWDIVTKFGNIVDMDSPERAVTSILKTQYRNNSAAIVTKISMTNNKIITKLLLVKWLLKQQILLIKNCNHFIMSCISRRSKTAKIIL